MSDEKPFVQNASDKNQVKKAGSKIKQIELLDLEGIKDMMATRASRRWVWKKLNWCRIFAPSFSPDPHQTAYNEGARLVGLEILKEVNKLPSDIYLTMVKEANEDKERGF